jgi:hypothetical protein
MRDMDEVPAYATVIALAGAIAGDTAANLRSDRISCADVDHLAKLLAPAISSGVGKTHRVAIAYTFLRSTQAHETPNVFFRCRGAASEESQNVKQMNVGEAQ